MRSISSISLFVALILSNLAIGQNNISNDFLGIYSTDLGYEFLVGKSIVRPYVFNPQTLDYRALYKKNDSLYTTYTTLLKEKSSTEESSFVFSNENGRKKLKVIDKDKSYNASKGSYVEEAVRFRSQGVLLKGSLLLPDKIWKHPLVVLVHGSGKQDRNGYAGYIRLMADYLVKNGTAVLIYDKRGCGESSGDWKKASFSDLAEDAVNAKRNVETHPNVDETSIGFGGSSQAGWILAKIAEKEPDTPFIFCVSGAGMGISASEQNIYNNLTELKALGANDEVLDSAKKSWQYLYKYVSTYNQEDKKSLDSQLSKDIDSKFRNYFPPSSNAFSKDRKEFWFQTLEVNYNPLNSWKNYNGDLYSVFGELDASTPVSTVIKNLKNIGRQNAIRVYKNTSHLILQANIKSDSEFGKLKKFHPYFLTDLSNWILNIAGRQSDNVKKVLRLEKDWLKAYENKDTSTMREIVDDDFLITYPNGYKQNKQDILEYLMSDDESCINMKLYTTQSYPKEFGNVIVLRGLVTTECDNGESKFYQRQRYTDTYLLKDGKWKVIASHLSKL